MSPAALRRAAPAAVAAALGALYVAWSPASIDLAAHLFRVSLFRAEGFGPWDNWWYAGHETPAYSVFFPPVAAALGPQLAAALAVVGAVAVFEVLARSEFGERAWLGSTWLAVGAGAELYSGRLTFAFGILPGVAAVLALVRGRGAAASVLGVLTALASPVAALFTALAGVAYAAGGLGGREVARGGALALASLAPVAVLAVLFPEGGTEPFAFSALWPVLLIAALAAFSTTGALRAGALLYGAGCVLAYALATPVGGNAARLGALLAGPLAALVLWPRRARLLAAAAIPLLYVQLQAPVHDVVDANAPATTAAYYRPLLAFLARQGGVGRTPFRVEIPFTADHWEAYEVAPHFPLARGWERQLDVRDNPLFYRPGLTAATYRAWLHRLAVRFVAVADTAVDYSARAEVALIDHGLPYLRPVWRSRHWRVYAVHDPTPIVTGATLRALGPDSLTIAARHAGSVTVRVRFTPYWALDPGPGCVAPDGDFTRITLRRPGTARLVIRFALDRVGARSARCS